ncbi:transposase [Amycolatopsis sp. CA-128772]|uniref:transposase n=1 Tax=Amycolatopsis sp. CA-128772 TaxID=2073159 RepID=UPI00351A3A73
MVAGVARSGVAQRSGGGAESRGGTCRRCSVRGRRCGPGPAPQGAGSNYTDLLSEPPDHAIGRSRGGWSTKVHHLVDGNGRPLVTLVGSGQAGAAPMFPHLMRHLRIRRAGRGRARTRPHRVRGDKAYSSRTIRGHHRSAVVLHAVVTWTEALSDTP